MGTGKTGSGKRIEDDVIIYKIEMCGKKIS